MNDSLLSLASSSNSCDNFPNPRIPAQSSNSRDSADFEITGDANCSGVSSTTRNHVPCSKTIHSKSQNAKNSTEKSPLIKFCRVCGDKALGYNFDVVTCESCKAFFRRNALKSKVFRCPFNDDCDVSIVSRRFCQKCRLKKCFDVGMKKESIMSEQDRLMKRRKRTASNLDSGNELVSPSQNSAVHCDSMGFNSGPKNPFDVPITCSTNNEDNVTIPKSALMILLNSSKKSDAALETIRCVCKCVCGARSPETLLFPDQKDQSTSTENLIDSTANRQSVISSLTAHCDAHNFAALTRNGPDFGATDDISILPRNISDVEQLLRNHQSFNILTGNLDFGAVNSAAGQLFNDAVDAAISREMDDVIGAPGGGVYHLTLEEQNRLAELIAANEIFEEPMESGDARSLTDFVNLMDIGIRRIIRMAKRIDSFKNLCKEDQIALLKGGCVELMVLRGVMAFDPVKDTWRGPKSYCIKSENVREVKGDVYDEYKKYFHSFEENLRTNESIMVILLAVTLFISDRPNVQHEDLIKNEQSTYVALLKNYLNSIYDQKRALLAYERLMSNLDDLHKLTMKVVSIFLHVNPKDVEPLLLEMFDWKR